MIKAPLVQNSPKWLEQWGKRQTKVAPWTVSALLQKCTNFKEQGIVSSQSSSDLCFICNTSVFQALSSVQYPCTPAVVANIRKRPLIMLDRLLWTNGEILALQDAKWVSSADLCDQFGSLVNEVNEAPVYEPADMKGDTSSLSDCSRWHSKSLVELGKDRARHGTARQGSAPGLSHLNHPLVQAEIAASLIQSCVGSVRGLWGDMAHQQAVCVGNILRYQRDSWTFRELTTSLFAKKREPLTQRISLSQAGLSSIASNNRMLPFLPTFNDLSSLNYAPLVTVIFPDLDR